MKKISIVTFVLGISLFSVVRWQLVAGEPVQATAAARSLKTPDSVEYKVVLPEERTKVGLFQVGEDGPNYGGWLGPARAMQKQQEISGVAGAGTQRSTSP